MRNEDLKVRLVDRPIDDLPGIIELWRHDRDNYVAPAPKKTKRKAAKKKSSTAKLVASLSPEAAAQLLEELQGGR